MCFQPRSMILARANWSIFSELIDTGAGVGVGVGVAVAVGVGVRVGGSVGDAVEVESGVAVFAQGSPSAEQPERSKPNSSASAMG